MAAFFVRCKKKAKILLIQQNDKMFNLMNRFARKIVREIKLALFKIFTFVLRYFIFPIARYTNVTCTSEFRAIFTLVSKVIRDCTGFALLSTLCDWSRKLAPPSQPIRCKSKTNRDLVTRVFPRSRPVTCIDFEFSLAPSEIFLCSDWTS